MAAAALCTDQQVHAHLTRLARKGITLSLHGRTRDTTRHPFDLHELSAAMRDIPRIWRKTKHARELDHRSSYGLKHDLEEWRDARGHTETYIANGCFILAMMLCGHRPTRWDGPNCTFVVRELTGIQEEDSGAHDTCPSCRKASHDFQHEEVMECIPPLHVLKFGDYVMDRAYRDALHAFAPHYCTEEIMGSYFGHNPHWPCHDTWLHALCEACRQEGATECLCNNPAEDSDADDAL